MPLMKLGVFGKIVLIIVALVLALLIWDLFIRTLQKIRNTEPVKTAKAKVIFKEILPGTLDTYSVCFITLEQKPVELYPNEAAYNGLEVGQIGMLTYQGSQLISFEAEQ